MKITPEMLYPYINRMIFQNPDRWLGLVPIIPNFGFEWDYEHRNLLLEACVQHAATLDTGVPDACVLRHLSYETWQWMRDQVQYENYYETPYYKEWEVAMKEWMENIYHPFVSSYHVPPWAARIPLLSWRAARRTFVRLYISKTYVIKPGFNPHLLSWMAFWESIRDTSEWHRCYQTGTGSGHATTPGRYPNTPFEHAITHAIDWYRDKYIERVGYSVPPPPPQKPRRPEGLLLAKLFAWNGSEPLRMLTGI